MTNECLLGKLGKLLDLQHEETIQFQLMVAKFHDCRLHGNPNRACQLAEEFQSNIDRIKREHKKIVESFEQCNTEDNPLPLIALGVKAGIKGAKAIKKAVEKKKAEK